MHVYYQTAFGDSGMIYFLFFSFFLLNTVGSPGARLGCGWVSGTWRFLGRQARHRWSPQGWAMWPQVCGRNAGPKGGAGRGWTGMVRGWRNQACGAAAENSPPSWELPSQWIAGDLYKAGRWRPDVRITWISQVWKEGPHCRLFRKDSGLHDGWYKPQCSLDDSYTLLLSNWQCRESCLGGGAWPGAGQWVLAPKLRMPETMNHGHQMDLPVLPVPQI